MYSVRVPENIGRSGSGGGGWRILSILGRGKGKSQQPLTEGQTAAFNQGAGPVSPQGAQNWGRQQLANQDFYRTGLYQQPSIMDVLNGGGNWRGGY